MRCLVRISAVALLSLAPLAAWAQVYGDPNALVDYWYRTYLGRPPDPAGAAGWVNALNQGTPPDQVLAGMLGSAEFYSRAGSTPQGYITLLYQDILGRPPTVSELNFWVSRMYTQDRTTIADQILTQNPGVWVGASPVATPPVAVPPSVLVTPGLEWQRHRDWERDRHWDWSGHHGIHEYRRPEIHVHRPEHHEHHR